MPWEGPSFLGGISILRLVQSMHAPWLDTLFIGLTLLGSEEFFLVVVPLVYWWLDRRAGRRMGHLFFFSAFLNVWLKAAFHTARPPATEVRVNPNASGTGYAFPSGHTQNAATFWGYLAWSNRRRWLTVLGLVVVLLVGLSRLYLGVHWPGDVVSGLFLGYAVSWVWVRLGRRLREESGAVARPLRAAAGFLLPVFLLLVHRESDAVKLVAAFSGFSGGGALAGEGEGPATGGGGFWRNALCLMVGISGLFLIRAGLKPALPVGIVSDFVRYWLIGLWVSLIGPWFFGWLWQAPPPRRRRW